MRLAVPQKRLGPRGFLACALAINMMVIMAIDMYTPALPGLKRELAVSASTLNLTMFAFFFMSALGVFVAGPLSDRFGRRPPLVGASVLFLLGSIACALAPGIGVLVFGRVLQAVGYGAVATVETALVKDAFEGDDLQFAMTMLQSLIVAGPVIAPFLGTFVLTVAGWRDIFWVLALMGIACLVCSLLISETLAPEHRMKGGVLGSLGQSTRSFGTLLKAPRFSSLALTLAFAAVPYAAFLAAVSYILLDEFQTGYLTYSIVYAVVSLTSVSAPFLYMRLSRGLSVPKILAVSLWASIVAAVLMLTAGRVSPALFCVSFMPFVLAEGVIRPMSFVVLLDQPPELVGSASALVNLMYSIFSSAGTVVATLEWPSFTLGLGVVLAASSAAMVLFSSLFVRARRAG